MHVVLIAKEMHTNLYIASLANKPCSLKSSCVYYRLHSYCYQRRLWTPRTLWCKNVNLKVWDCLDFAHRVTHFLNFYNKTFTHQSLSLTWYFKKISVKDYLTFEHLESIFVQATVPLCVDYTGPKVINTV